MRAYLKVWKSQLLSNKQFPWTATSDQKCTSLQDNNLALRSDTPSAAAVRMSFQVQRPLILCSCQFVAAERSPLTIRRWMPKKAATLGPKVLPTTAAPPLLMEALADDSMTAQSTKWWARPVLLEHKALWISRIKRYKNDVGMFSRQ